MTGECGAALFNPCGLAVSANGEVFIADTGHHRLCVLDSSGVLRVLAGCSARGFADGVGLEAAFAHPCGLTIDSEGMLYVADCGNHRIRRVTPDGVVSTVAGNGSAAHRDGQGRAASFYNPCGITVDHRDTLYVADYSNNCVRVVSKGGVVATILCHDGAPALDAPYGIAVHWEPCGSHDAGGAQWIFVSSYHSNSIASISPDGHVSVLVGCGAAKHRDGFGKDAAFHAPNGLAIDAEGNLYVADSGNHCVRMVSQTGEVTTMAGTGYAALSESEFNAPCGLCVCLLPGHGPTLLVTDRANSCVRSLSMETPPPARVAPSTLRQDLRRLRDGDAGSFIEGEAVFEVDGHTLRAAKAVLCVRCPHFRAMFTSGMRESSERVIRLPDVPYAAFRSLIDYLLTDEVPEPTPAEQALDLIVLANAYQMTRLEQICEQRLLRLLDKDNAADVASCAELIGSSQLVRAARRVLGQPASPPRAPIVGSCRAVDDGNTSPVEIF
mmetsp:Transcript_18449/g.60357  ORF Transcript_18449/g.60357 Transcript_18449/m.60357 type:complete len:496 (+) Transcript_18449:63-1550(+)